MSDIHPSDDPTTAALLAEQRQEESLHQGRELRAAADRLVERLPRGPVCLLTRNAEGTAIAAAAAALRVDPGPLCWEEIALHRPYEAPTGYKLVFVDALDLTGSWLLDEISRIAPGVLLIDRLAEAPTSRALAA